MSETETGQSSSARTCDLIVTERPGGGASAAFPTGEYIQYIFMMS